MHATGGLKCAFSAVVQLLKKAFLSDIPSVKQMTCSNVQNMRSDVNFNKPFGETEKACSELNVSKPQPVAKQGFGETLCRYLVVSPWTSLRIKTKQDGQGRPPPLWGNDAFPCFRFPPIFEKIQTVENKPFQHFSFWYRLTYIDRYVITSGCVVRTGYFYLNQSRRLKI